MFIIIGRHFFESHWIYHSRNCSDIILFLTQNPFSSLYYLVVWTNYRCLHNVDTLVAKFVVVPAPVECRQRLCGVRDETISSWYVNYWNEPNHVQNGRHLLPPKIHFFRIVRHIPKIYRRDPDISFSVPWLWQVPIISYENLSGIPLIQVGFCFLTSPFEQSFVYHEEMLIGVFKFWMYLTSTVTRRQDFTSSVWSNRPLILS